MIKKEDIHELANLARIHMSDQEETELTTEVESILGFVKQIQEVEVDIQKNDTEEILINVFREDNNPHDSSLYTDRILEEAPASKDGYIKVKKIL